MGGKRERNRIRCAVDDLPEAIRSTLDCMLGDVRITYQEIADSLTETGYPISRSAIGRYALRHNSAAKRIREARQQTEALISQLKDNQDIESSEIATAILIDSLTRRIATAEEEIDSIPIDKAGKLIIDLQRSAVYKERYRKDRLAVVAAVESNIMARLRRIVQDDPQLLEQLQQAVAEAAAEETSALEDK